MVIYEHRQIGTLMITALGAAMVLGAAPLLSGEVEDGSTTIGIVLAILLLCLFLFWSLTVEVRRGQVQARFGSGLIRRTVQLADIQEARVVRNPWYAGWGIRLIPRGVIYNVSGFGAVELELSNGRRFRIGTDEPQALLEAIQLAMRQAR